MIGNCFKSNISYVISVTIFIHWSTRSFTHNFSKTLDASSDPNLCQQATGFFHFFACFTIHSPLSSPPSISVSLFLFPIFVSSFQYSPKLFHYFPPLPHPLYLLLYSPPLIEYDNEIHENSVRTNTSYTFFFRKSGKKSVIRC